MQQPGHYQGNSFIWVKLIWECCPDADSDSTVPEILWAQSYVGHGWYRIANGLIGFLQIKEETNCLLLHAQASRTCLSRITRFFIMLQCFLKPHWLLSWMPYFLKIPDETRVNHALQDLAYTTGQCDFSETKWVSVVFVWLGDRDHSCCSPLREITRDTDVVQDLFEDP